MLRTVAVRALRASSTRRVARQFANARPQSITFSFRFSRIAPTYAVSSVRCYSASAGLSKEEVQGRIMDLLKNFDKVCRSGVYPQRASVTDRMTGYRSIEGTHFAKQVSHLNTDHHRSPAHLTSRTTLAWTAWIPSKWSWPLRRNLALRYRTRRRMSFTVSNKLSHISVHSQMRTEL